MKVTNLQSFCFVNYSPHRFIVGYGKEYCTHCLSQVGYIYIIQSQMGKSKLKMDLFLVNLQAIPFACL